MDLIPYRRHTPKCAYASEGSGYIKCKCPIWVSGTPEKGGKRVRQTLGTRSWSRAQERIQQLGKSEDSAVSDSPEKPARSPKRDGAGQPALRSLTAAREVYLADCTRRNLSSSTIHSYTKTLNAFCAFAPLQSIEDFSLATLTAFHAGREVTAQTQRKEIEHMRAWCAFLLECGWIAKNFAKSIKPPKTGEVQTLPFTAPEVQRLIDACREVGAIHDGWGKARRTPDSLARERADALALILLLLYSGLRISDAIKLHRSRIDLRTRTLALRTMKNKRRLRLTLHKDAVEALAALPHEHEYFFWYRGVGRLESYVEHARQLIKRVAKRAGVPNAHPHRFRDTFATSLLLKGVNLRTVSLLLGHTSIKTTEQHYAPFVREYQDVLDNATSLLDFSAAS